MNIGFISTRFAGIDGVSLEASKWAQVLEEMGHHCYWFAGELERDPSKSFLTPEAHFNFQVNEQINQQVFCHGGRKSDSSKAIDALTSLLKIQLYCFIHQFDIDLLIIQNALAIPMHIPLGLSLTEVIAETKIPTIAHHHDFYWERSRYLVNGSGEYLNRAFPPKLPNILHVVINTDAQENLASRCGIPSMVIPNIIDFDSSPIVNEVKVKAFRKSIGLKAQDKMILQPTRIVRRKGIEHAIELVKALNDPAYKLVISHDAGDEGFEYADWLERYALKSNIDLRMVNAKIADPFISNGGSKADFSLWDIYPSAEMITYPSLCEGFGNALLEGVYFKKPVLINQYPIYQRDIKPKGFDFIEMDGFLSQHSIEKVKGILESPIRKEAMVNHNYAIASCHYSYDVLRNHLAHLIGNVFNMAESPMAHTLSGQNKVIYLDTLSGTASESFYQKNVRYAART